MAPRKTSDYVGKPVKKAKVPVKIKPKSTKNLARELGTSANNQFKYGLKNRITDPNTRKVYTEKEFVALDRKALKGRQESLEDFKKYTEQEKAYYRKRRKVYARQTGV